MDDEGLTAMYEFLYAHPRLTAAIGLLGGMLIGCAVFGSAQLLADIWNPFGGAA